jgi:hypothetical protein
MSIQSSKFAGADGGWITFKRKILPDPGRATLVVVSYLSLVATADRKKSKRKGNLSDLKCG